MLRGFRARSLSLLVPVVALMACSDSPKETLDGLDEVGSRGGYVFPVHLTVLSSRADVTAAATESQLIDEVGIFYEYFVTKEGEKIVGFSFLSASLHEDVASLGCDVVKMANDGKSHTSSQWRGAIKDCDHTEVVHPEAINVFVYDAFADGSYASEEGRGDLNAFHPYIMLDWARLDHRGQSDEEHEMGHAFGLSDICHTTATRLSSTNIMATDGKYPDGSGGEADCPGEKGKRDLGFNETQEARILENAKLIHEALLL